MRKLSVVLAVVFCVGAAGLLWADDLNPQPFPPKGTGSTGDGTHERKAGENNVTLHDQNQISGNLNGDGKTGDSFDKHDGFQKTEGKSKVKSHSSGGGAGKTKITGNSVKGPTSGNGGMQKHKGKGESKDPSHSSGSGAGKVSINGGDKTSISSGGNKAGLNFTHGTGLQKGNGLAKNGSKKGVLIGLSKTNSFQKANGLQKAGAGPGGGPGVSGGLGESSSR